MNKWLILIILAGIILRLFQLGEASPGFFRDEAALGFNAYAILEKGADEYGHKFPAVFRSFEVFFMPAYVYLSVPVVFLFGLNEFSTRFISSLSGIVLIMLTFLITKKLTASNTVPLISAALIAFSPWSIFYSRGAFEGNLALLFFSIGFYFWLLYFDTKKKIYFIFSVCFFVLSMYSYQSPRLVAPLLVLFSILLLPDWRKQWRLWLSGVLVALVLYMPIVLLLNSPASQHRAIGVSIFSGTQKLPWYSQQLGDWQKVYIIPRELASLYLHYYSPSNLFWFDDYNKQRGVEGFSSFFFWLAPFYIYGLWVVFQNRRKYIFLLIWFLLAPIPAALTRDPFHTYRAILLFVPATIIISVGIVSAIESFRKKNWGWWLFWATLIFSTIYFAYNLFIVNPYFRWRDWDYGYDQIAQFIKSQPDELRVVIDDPQTESYIFFLFYKLLALEVYQDEAIKIVSKKDYYWRADKLRSNKIGRFEFRKVDWPTERGDRGTLFIFPANRLYPSEFSGDPKLQLVKQILSPIGEPAFNIIRVH